MNGTIVIDPLVWQDLQDTAGADFAIELVETFLEEAPVMLVELREALGAGDDVRFRRAAHSLKSNSQTFGAAALGAMAREIELGGLHAEPAHDTAALHALDAAYAQAAAALKELTRG